MLMGLGKHIGEFLRAYRNGHFEEVGDGRLLFPKQRAYLGGVIGISRNFGPVELADNLVVQQGRDYLLNCGLNAGPQLSAWYIVPFATNTVVPDNLTSANFNATLTEFTNYTQTQRQTWQTDGSSSGVITNSAHIATITIGGGAQTAVYGAGLQSQSAKSANTGVCFSAALAPTAKTGLEAGETLSFTYGVTATSS